MFWPCETRTSTCRNFATISSGLYRFLAITVLLDVKDIPQVGPLRWGLIKIDKRSPFRRASRMGRTIWPAGSDVYHLRQRSRRNAAAEDRLFITGLPRAF